ncbi:uncharacterized protein IWZ02DRAFT_491736 [Phyllosticta citriasiana]|uniref:uncharacterized protein n=1 Tax=Phyllosticta citriasiana TaxID=595635 RepID=UPI0030FD5C90
MAMLSKEEVLRRLRAVGIDNLVDDAIKPRQHPDATKPKVKLSVYKAATPILPLDQWDHTMIMGLANLVEEVNDDHAKVKELLFSEVRSRQGSFLNSYKYVSELRAADVAKFLKTRRAQVAGSTRKRCADTATYLQQPRSTTIARCMDGFQITSTVASAEGNANRQGSSHTFQRAVDANDVPGLRNEHQIGDGSKTMVDMHDEMNAEIKKSFGYKNMENQQQKSGTRGESLDGRKNGRNLSHGSHDNSLATMDQHSTPERLATVTILYLDRKKLSGTELPLQVDDDAAAEAAYHDMSDVVITLRHLREIHAVVERDLEMPWRKMPEPELEAAMTEAKDVARQTMHNALREEGDRAARQEAKEDWAAFSRAEMEWNRTMVARMAQMECNTAHSEHGFNLLPNMKELYESIVL